MYLLMILFQKDKNIEIKNSNSSEYYTNRTSLNAQRFGVTFCKTWDPKYSAQFLNEESNLKLHKIKSALLPQFFLQVIGKSSQFFRTLGFPQYLLLVSTKIDYCKIEVVADLTSITFILYSFTHMF